MGSAHHGLETSAAKGVEGTKISEVVNDLSDGFKKKNNIGKWGQLGEMCIATGVHTKEQKILPASEWENSSLNVLVLGKR